MSREEILAMGVACALRDAGRPENEWWGAFERVAAAASGEIQALVEMRNAGFDFARAIEVFEEWERLSEKHPANGRPIARAEPLKAVIPAARALYERAPRTKKYGPSQDPDAYFSAEKLRAYNYAARFIEGTPTQRLAEQDWWPLVGEVFRRDGYICTYCGADGETYKLHCDHIAPISRGGPNDLENLTTACDYCNCSKRDALPHKWRPLRGVAQ